MAYGDFTYPTVLAEFGLTLSEADLFGHVPAADVAADFAEDVRQNTLLALAINTEKARSEFIVAPVLSRLWRGSGGAFGLFSGVPFNVDPARGLTGFCDFILTKSAIQSVLSAPVVVIAEAKNEHVQSGFGQCIAGMVAARDFNAKAGRTATVYGVSTTGVGWKFARLDGDDLVLDKVEYQIGDLGRIMGILTHILRNG